MGTGDVDIRINTETKWDAIIRGRNFRADFFVGCVSVGLFLVLFGGIICAILLGLEVGGIGYLCGLYGNKYVPSNCYIEGIGSEPIIDRAYISETGTWGTTVVDYTYHLDTWIVTTEKPEFIGRIRVIFEEESQLNEILEEYNYTSNETFTCNILNFILDNDGYCLDCDLIRVGDKSFKQLLLKDGWNKHKFTFEADPACPYLYVYTFGIIGGWLVASCISGLIFACWCSGGLRYNRWCELRKRRRKAIEERNAIKLEQMKRKPGSKRKNRRCRDREREKCPICRDVFDSIRSSASIVELSCRHQFHQKCYNTWRGYSSNNRDICPMCRQKPDKNKSRTIVRMSSLDLEEGSSSISD